MTISSADNGNEMCRDTTEAREFGVLDVSPLLGDSCLKLLSKNPRQSRGLLQRLKTCPLSVNDCLILHIFTEDRDVLTDCG
jgi:hypothetical protein